MDKHRSTRSSRRPAGPRALIDLVNGDYGPGGSSTFPAVAGYPHITVPAGYAFGLPVGVSFFGRAWSEPDAHPDRVRLRAGHEAPQGAGVRGIRDGLARRLKSR